jgi:hypothetical protein
MYLTNKYTNWYFNIIKSAQLRMINGYTEKHHIIPKSLGGTNNKINLVALTAKEHFICHLLLTKMTTGKDKSKMVLAVFKMMGKGKRNRANCIKSSRMYEILKIELSQIVSKQHKGRKRLARSSEYRKKQSISHQGRNSYQFRGEYITPWGTFDSGNLAAKHSPNYITGNYLRNICTIKNKTPINLLSVCRSKGFLKEDYIGKTPFDLGFKFAPAKRTNNC